MTGQLLIAMPQMEDPRFARSVVYLCAHSEETGTMGLIVNKTIDALTIDELYARLKIESMTRTDRPQLVYFGGPVDPGCGFVPHSADYHEDGTVGIRDGFAMIATFDILRAMGKCNGPRQYILALGCAGWARASSRPRFKPMVGCQLPPIPALSSTPTMAANGTVHSPSSASARRCFLSAQDTHNASSRAQQRAEINKFTLIV